MKEQNNREPKRQVKFECSEEFYGRLMSERVQRNLTLHELAIRALKAYLAVPEYLHRSVRELAEESGGSVGGFIKAALNFRVRQARQRNRIQTRNPPSAEQIAQLIPDPSWVERFDAEKKISEYLHEFPVEYLRLLRDSMELDLKYYRSARIKPSAGRPPVPVEKTPANEEGAD